MNETATAPPTRDGTNQTINSSLPKVQYLTRMNCVQHLPNRYGSVEVHADFVSKLQVIEPRTNRTAQIDTTFCDTQSRAKRPTMSPPKKPDEIYPDEGPPPLIC